MQKNPTSCQPINSGSCILSQVWSLPYQKERIQLHQAEDLTEALS